MNEKFCANSNKRNLRVVKFGDAEMREIGWVRPDGSALLHVQHHANSCYWRVVFPVADGLVPVGSGLTLRDAYREACRQRRLLRRAPERMARSRANALRTAWEYRQQARRYAETINRLGALHAEALARERDLKEHLAAAERKLAAAENQVTQAMLGTLKYEGSLREQLDAANAKLSAEYDRGLKQAARYRELQAQHTGLLARYATQQGKLDEMRKQLGLPTSDDLVVRGAGAVYPIREEQNA